MKKLASKVEVTWSFADYLNTWVKGMVVDFDNKGVLEVFYHVTSKHSTLVETNVLAHFFRRLSDNSNRYYGRSSKYVIIEF